MAVSWDDIDFNDGYNGSIYINKTLLRVTVDALRRMKPDDLIFTFPPESEGCKTRLILCKPKTKGSIRTVFLTSQLKTELLERKEQVEKDKLYWGNEYMDYGLVFCSSKGAPRETKRNERLFKQWQEKHEELMVPKIVFHELRHSSISYMLYVSDGERKDLLSVMSGARHENIETTIEYLHDNMGDRRQLIQKAEQDFWGTRDEGICNDTVLTLDNVETTNVIWEFAKQAAGAGIKSPAEFRSPKEYLKYVSEAMKKQG